MGTVKFVLYKSNKRKDGSYPVCLRVYKKGKLKYIDLKLSALEGQWNEDTCRFKNDKRVNPNYELYNATTIYNYYLYTYKYINLKTAMRF